MDWFSRFATQVTICIYLLGGWQGAMLAAFAEEMEGDLLSQDLVPAGTWSLTPPVSPSLTFEVDHQATTGEAVTGPVRQVANLSLPVEPSYEVDYDVWRAPGLSPVLEPGLAIDDRLPSGNAKIPFEILASRSQKKGQPKQESTTSLPVVLHPATTINSAGREIPVGEVDKATFKTELEILESQWNVDFKMGMQETSEDGNRVRLGTVARYRTPEQLLKINMDFEQSQGEEEQDTNRLQLGTLARYRWEGKELEVDMKYERRQDEQENVTNRVLLDGTHEWFFNSSRWSHYLGGKVEYDQLEAFDSRFETNTGFAYSLLKNKSSHVKVKAGTMVAREIGVEEEGADLFPESLYGVSINQNVTAAQKLSTTVDYIPTWNDFQQYEVKAEANWQLILDQESDFRLKVGARNRYDSNMPIESIEEGMDYTTSLMWVY